MPDPYGYKQLVLEIGQWLMTNYWETNFAAGLGGFHSFRFKVFQPDTVEPEKLTGKLRVANDGLVTFRLPADC